MAFITDSSDKGPNGIIVVDLASGRSWRRLHDHPSTKADPAMLALVEGRPVMERPPGGPPKPVTMGCDGIAIAHDGSRLFYCPLVSRRLYSVSVDALVDDPHRRRPGGGDGPDHGEKGPSDGLESDDRGRLYATNYEQNAVLRRSPDGRFETLVHDPRVLWPDTLSVARDGYLYFTANQLHRQARYHEGKDLRQKPYVLFRSPGRRRAGFIDQVTAAGRRTIRPPPARRDGDASRPPPIATARQRDSTRQHADGGGAADEGPAASGPGAPIGGDIMAATHVRPRHAFPRPQPCRDLARPSDPGPDGAASPTEPSPASSGGSASAWGSPRWRRPAGPRPAHRRPGRSHRPGHPAAGGPAGAGRGIGILSRPPARRLGLGARGRRRDGPRAARRARWPPGAAAAGPDGGGHARPSSASRPLDAYDAVRLGRRPTRRAARPGERPRSRCTRRSRSTGPPRSSTASGATSRTCRGS